MCIELVKKEFNEKEYFKKNDNGFFFGRYFLNCYLELIEFFGLFCFLSILVINSFVK